MNLKIIKKTENQAIIEFVGEGHTILNLLRTELLADERVLMATYDTKFPIMDNPVFRLTTSGVDPIVVLREATGRIIGQCEEFSRQYRRGCKVTAISLLRLASFFPYFLPEALRSRLQTAERCGLQRAAFSQTSQRLCHRLRGCQGAYVSPPGSGRAGLSTARRSSRGLDAPGLRPGCHRHYFLSGTQDRDAPWRPCETCPVHVLW